MTDQSKPKHTISDLYDVLFTTIQGVREGSVPLETAEAINNLSQTVVNAAKVQVDFTKVTGSSGVGGGFLPQPDGKSTPQPGVTRHTLL